MKFPRILSIALLVASACLLAWSLWPAPHLSRGFNLAGERFPELAGQPYRLVLDWPAWLRAGELGQVELRLEPLGAASQPPLPASSNHVVLEGRLELGGLVAEARQTAQTPVIPGKGAEVIWMVQALRAGSYEGTAWSYLDKAPASGVRGSQEPVGAQGLAVQVVSILGLGQKGALGVGLAGLAVGVAGLMIWRRTTDLNEIPPPTGH